jgi:hypothetical protein
LVHLPIIYILVESPYAQRNLGDVTQIAQIAAVLLSILLSSLIYRLVEVRFHQFDGSNEPRAIQLKSKWIVVLTSASLTLSLTSIPIVKSEMFGVLSASNNANPGVDFKKYCARDQFIYQFPCSFPGRAENGTIALVGDSHASQYSLVISELAKARGMKLFLLGDFGGEVNSSRTMDSIRTLDPDVIIVSKFWREEFLQKNSGMIQDLDELRTLSQHFLVVGQNPVFVQVDSGPGVSLFDILLGGKALKVDSPTVLPATKESRAADILIRSWAIESKVAYLDTFRILCPTTSYCDKFLNGKPIYIDSNHLSVSGAQILKVEFEKFLDSRN